MPTGSKDYNAEKRERMARLRQAEAEWDALTPEQQRPSADNLWHDRQRFIAGRMFGLALLGLRGD